MIWLLTDLTNLIYQRITNLQKSKALIFNLKSLNTQKFQNEILNCFQLSSTQKVLIRRQVRRELIRLNIQHTPTLPSS